MKKSMNVYFIAILVVVLLVGGFRLYRTIKNNEAMSMGTSDTHSTMNMGTSDAHSIMNMGSTDTASYMTMDKNNGMNMGSSDPNATSVTQLVAQKSNAPEKTFNITAQVANINLGNGKTIQAWTFGGTIPGPEIRVKQGDRVIVNLTNKLPEGVTIHWHGINVPGAEDGVAGVTQDAIKPGETYTYNFIADQPGTYWYHSHQQSELETARGLFGAIIVEPKEEPVKYDKDYTVVLHEWNVKAGSSDTNFKDNQKKKISEAPADINNIAFNNKDSRNNSNKDNFKGSSTNNELIRALTDVKYDTLTTNDTTGSLHFDAKPGELVRLRLVNAGNATHLLTLLDTPFQVVALDGRDLVGGATIDKTLLPIGGGQRYDISFRMPQSGSVQLVSADQATQPNKMVSVTIGSGEPIGTNSNPNNYKWFDFTTYGTPQKGIFSTDSTFTKTIEMKLGSGKGSGGKDWSFQINGKSSPDVPPLVVKKGDTVKINFINNDDAIHPMHLHGHTLQVLTRNGKPLEGSPVYLDTLNVLPHETYEVAFVADNPGIWMIHCHNLKHAAMGMDMMLNYEGISTPFVVGGTSGNQPE
ncbi:multicopper oxidase family protein [Paenibacillus sp. HWE-109]|uniref:multicopper oxidase family protein n=1 Tax=Paenibacillus sp. HWE-109 TaxID=1306526 RepID=UPI001EDDF002|nr:multicopper oxidase family protein [Paenibacillus sp. HWE-109]UKS28537.1 multicopper oxidase family protein [Paenibacillus sp. HWE-109]